MPALPYSPFWFSRRLNGLRHQLSNPQLSLAEVEHLQCLIEHTEMLRVFCSLTCDVMTMQADAHGGTNGRNLPKGGGSDS